VIKHDVRHQDVRKLDFSKIKDKFKIQNILLSLVLMSQVLMSSHSTIKLAKLFLIKTYFYLDKLNNDQIVYVFLEIF